MARPRILLAAPFAPDAERRLEARADVIRPAAGAPLDGIVKDCDGLLVRTNVPVTLKLLAAGPRLRAVGVAGVGVDNVDLAAAAELKIEVLHVPDASSDAVAEFAFGLLLQLLRPFREYADQYRAGNFERARSAARGRELRELSIGVLGLGQIGSRFARLCSAGAARVIYHDILPVQPRGFTAEAVSASELWRQADVLSLHVPLTAATRGLISAEVLQQMKPGALLINTARGPVVDTTALVDALQSNRLAGAALDVTDPEPLPPDHPLFHQMNCILTPHVAARTPGGMRRMFGIVERVIDYLERTPPR